MINKKHFSLIELLVVISILAILLSILLPALNRAKKTAKQISCTSQQKQIAVCFAMYADDFDEYYPACSDPNWTWPNQWFMFIAKYAKYPYYPGNFPTKFTNTIFVCPSAEDDKNCHDLGNNVQLGIGMSRNLPPADTVAEWWKAYKVYPKTKMIKKPSSRILTADSWTSRLEGHWEFSQPAPTCYALHWQRHQKGANLAFCDGHVQWVPGKDILAKGLAYTLYIDFDK